MTIAGCGLGLSDGGLLLSWCLVGGSVRRDEGLIHRVWPDNLGSSRSYSFSCRTYRLSGFLGGNQKSRLRVWMATLAHKSTDD
mgnify:FL=1